MKKKFRTIKQYCMNNWLFIAVMLFFSILLILQMKNVVFYADDFQLKHYSNQGLKFILNYQKWHFLNWGGGFTPILVMVFFLFRPIIWKLFICALVIVMGVLSVKVFKPNNQFQKSLLCIIYWSLFFLININVVNQALYWADGAFAYTFTITQLFLFIYYVSQRVFNDEWKKYDIIIFSLISFFAGWSSAQTGGIVAIISVIALIYLFFVRRKKTIRKAIPISLILGIIGFLIFYFMPGNWARMDQMGEFVDLGIFDKILYKLPSIYQFIADPKNTLVTSVPFYYISLISLTVLNGIHFIQKEKKKVTKYALISMVVFLSLILGYYLLNQITNIDNELLRSLLTFHSIYDVKNNLSFTIVIPYIIASLSFVSIIFVLWYGATKKHINYMILLCVLSAFLSQGLMIMSPSGEYRTTFICTMFLIIAIMGLIKSCVDNKIDNYSILIVPLLFIEYGLGIFYMIITVIIHGLNISRKNIINIMVLLLMFLGVSAISYVNMYTKYKQNAVIYYENVSILEKSKNESEITLYTPPYYEYGFATMQGIKWIEDDLKDLYHLKPDAVFVATEFK